MFVGDMTDSVFFAMYSSAPEMLEQMELPNENEEDDYAFGAADTPLADEAMPLVDEAEDGVGAAAGAEALGPGGCRCRSGA